MHEREAYYHEQQDPIEVETDRDLDYFNTSL